MLQILNSAPTEFFLDMDVIAEWTGYDTALPLPVLDEDVDDHDSRQRYVSVAFLSVGPVDLTHATLSFELCLNVCSLGL